MNIVKRALRAVRKAFIRRKGRDYIKRARAEDPYRRRAKFKALVRMAKIHRAYRNALTNPETGEWRQLRHWRPGKFERRGARR